MFQSARVSIFIILMAGLPVRAQEVVPTFEGIKEHILNFEAANPGKTLTIPEVLSSLPERFRAGFTLVYDSNSLQGSTSQSPRAILFGDDASSLITFNGDASLRGNDSLEFAYLNETTGEIVFRFIKFPAGDANTGHVVVSEPNPPLCMGCHGYNPHFIWEQYPTWPRTFGSRWDMLDFSELQMFDAFRQGAATHPRYKNLVYEFKDLSDYAPYQKGPPSGDNPVNLAIELRPNTRLGFLLTRLQAKARVAEIQKAPDFEKHKYGFAYFLSGCDVNFGKQLLEELKSKTGMNDLFAYADFLGNPPLMGWHFSQNPPSVSPRVYFSSLWSFPALMNGLIWEQNLISDPDLAPFYSPIRFGEFVKTSEQSGYALTPRGQELWDVVDRLGVAPSTLFASEEATSLLVEAGMPVLSDENAEKACKLLAEKQLRILVQ
ncbi:MAG: hypothetical protein AB7T49_07510 [Oligoflexales bacterium]